MTHQDKKQCCTVLLAKIKIFNGIETVELCKPPIFKSESTTHGHSQRYNKQICKNNTRFNFLTNRITNKWNELPQEVINSKSVNEFKAKLDKCMNELIF